MPGISNSTDRFNGVVTSLAIKVPCVVVSTADLTLSGEQTVNGVAVVTGDRVLVNAQTAGAENGIYDVTSTEWCRAADWDGNRDATERTIVVVGTVTPGAHVMYQCDTSGNIVIGSTAVSFSVFFDPASAEVQNLQDVTDLGNTTTNDIDLTGSDLILDDAGEIKYGTVAGGEIGIRFDGDQTLEIYDISGQNTGVKIGPGIPDLEVNPIGGAGGVASSISIGENTTLQSDSAVATLNMSGEDSGAIATGFLQAGGVAFWMNSGPVRLQFTANAGAAEAEFNVASLKVSEISAPVADETAYGQFWVRDDADQTPMFRDDLGVDYELNSAGLSSTNHFNYQFNTSTAAADPGSGYFSFNNADPSLASFMYISETDADGVLRDTDLHDFLINGQIVRYQDNSDATNRGEMLVISGSTDFGGYRRYDVADLPNSGPFGQPANDQECQLYHPHKQFVQDGTIVGNNREILIWNSNGWYRSGTTLLVNASNPPQGGRIRSQGASSNDPQRSFLFMDTGNSTSNLWFCTSNVADDEGFFAQHIGSATPEEFGWWYKPAGAAERIFYMDINRRLNIDADSGFFMDEKGADHGHIAGKGEYWVLNSIPCRPYFTDDTGVDHALLGAGGSLPVGTVTDAILRWSGAAWVENTDVRIDLNANLILDSSSPHLDLRETGGTADEGNWIVEANGDELAIGTATDAAATAIVGDVLRAVRTSTTVNAVALGNFNFNVDQSVGAGQDNFVLVYDDATGEIGLEAAGAGAGDVVKVGTPVDNEVGVWTGDGTIEGDTGFIYNGTKAILESAGGTLLSLKDNNSAGNGATVNITFLDSADTVQASIGTFPIVNAMSIFAQGDIVMNAGNSAERAVTIEGYHRLDLATDAQLDDITDAINTNSAKTQGVSVYNTDQDVPVYAVGSANGSVWVDGAGTTINTPV